jgi:hypothetical protein
VRKHLLTGVLLCGKEGSGGYMSGRWTMTKKITCACKECQGVSIRAEYAEPLPYRFISGRLATPDAEARCAPTPTRCWASWTT